MKHHRQGDIRLQPIEKLPAGVNKLKDKTLAYGEVTGHSHRFADLDSIERYELNGRLYLQVFQPVLLIHEEHHEQVILPGTYEQIQEREYDYAEEEMKTVVD